jgi:hypothetical protein
MIVCSFWGSRVLCVTVVRVVLLWLRHVFLFFLCCLYVCMLRIFSTVMGWLAGSYLVVGKSNYFDLDYDCRSIHRSIHLVIGTTVFIHMELPYQMVMLKMAYLLLLES